MIKNLRDYRVAVKQLRRYKWIKEHISRRPISKIDIRSRSEDLAKVDELSGRLQSEVDEFEVLRKSTTQMPELDRIAELPCQLIRARIAVGWTQQVLATKCGVRREKILRYEKDSYRLATMAIVIKVSSVLSAGLREKADNLRQLEEWLNRRRAAKAQLSADDSAAQVADDGSAAQVTGDDSAAQLAGGAFHLAE